MKRPGMEKLLGGYAAGNLTEAERRALFEAALDDQQLFDALADEEALRELLADPACRRRILEATAGERRFAGWLRRPLMLAPAAGLAATAALAFFMLRVAVPQAQPPRVEMAKSVPPPAAAVAPIAPAAPAPARRERQFAPPPEAERKAAEPLAPPPALAPSPALAPQKPIPVEVTAAPAAPPEIRTIPKELPRLETRQIVQDFTASNFAAATPRAFDAAAPVFRYTLEQKLPGGDFVKADAALPLDPRASLRLRIQPAAAGYLYVIGSRGLLLDTKAEAMKEYIVDLPPREAAVSLVLSREQDRGPVETLVARSKARTATAPAASFATASEAAPPAGRALVESRALVEIKLSYR